MDEKVDLTQTVSLLQERIPSLIAVYHYGSTALGGARPDSDVDLGVLAQDKLDPETLSDLGSEIATLLGREVDLVDLSCAAPVLLVQVLEGKVLYNSNARSLAEFETVAMSRYCRLNEERREILRDIQARGAIYAR
jgi:predicted nucleotidyltransferase